jgi:hypothetical protein
VVVTAGNSSGNSEADSYLMIFASNGNFLGTFANYIQFAFSCVVTSSSLIIVDEGQDPGSIYTLNPNNGYNQTSFTDASLGYAFECLGMAVSPDGRIYIADAGLGIYVFTSNGTYIDVISAPAEDILSFSMAYSPLNGGRILVVDESNNRIVSFPTTLGAPSKSGAFRIAGPTSSVFMAAAAVLALLILV